MKKVVQKKQLSRKKLLETVPELQDGLNVIRCSGKSSVIHRIVLEHLSRNNGDAEWVDAGNNAVNSIFRKLDPGDVDFSRIRVARAFTAYQHHRLVEKTGSRSLTVLPEAGSLYEDAEVGYWEGREMLEDSIEKLEGMSLVSISGDSDHSAIVESAADNIIEVKETVEGRRVRSEDFETPFYRDSAGFQTTLDHWRELVVLYG